MKASRAVDVSSVLEAGRELEIKLAVPLPSFGSYTFPGAADVALLAHRSGRGVELKGSILAEAVGECARCLDEVRLPLRLEVGEHLEPDATATGRDAGVPFGESNILTGSELDVSDLTRQLIDSALPLVLVCSEDCPGLCGACGERRDGACRCPNRSDTWRT